MLEDTIGAELDAEAFALDAGGAMLDDMTGAERVVDALALVPGSAVLVL